MKVLLDTNVYIGALLSVDARERFRSTFYPLLPATVLSAIVAYELSVNAANARTRELLAEFVSPMEKAGRTVTPTFADWEQAAQVLSGISTREGSWKSKLPHLLNDVLIALGARRAGAQLVTHNGKDFRLIQRHVGFELRVLES
ncbi:MAG TPA: PIN domain-containing protein [Polyangiaceae bacterium]|nr:PIN domain-containing protein [Polyangiaceae bacterium]